MHSQEQLNRTNEKKKARRGALTVAILSLSLLTVMAGAAVAPVLNVLQAAFPEVSRTLIQMIVSVPALFIVITNLLFPRLSRKYRARSLLMVGLLLYTLGGCVAGVFNHIVPILCARALVGVGVGIIMPMSTGLIAFYFTRDKQDRLMGYSSAMNQLGGSIATLLSGLLAIVSWRASFLVYLMGAFSIVLCLRYLPNERIGAAASSHPSTVNTFRRYYPWIIAMLLLTFTFYIYPVNFALETAKAGVIPQGLIAVIMAIMDASGFLGGLAFSHIKKVAGGKTRFVAPLLFLVGYLLLLLFDGFVCTLVGSIIVGFAAGEGIPCIIAAASKQAGRLAVSTVLPLVSAALYTAQFLTPMLLSLVEKTVGEVRHLPYYVAACCAVLLFLWAFTMREPAGTHQVRQEDADLTASPQR